MRSTLIFAVTIASASFGSAANAFSTDPKNDLLPTYTGAAGQDLDITFADAFVLNGDLLFTVETAGRMGKASNTSYFFAIDRGSGTERLRLGLPAIGQGVTFDALVELRANGSASLTVFNGNDVQVVAPKNASVFFFRNRLDGGFDISALPSRGFSVDNYKYTAWSGVGSGNQGIADITRSSTFGAVPEPATWAMMIGGFGLLGCQARRRVERAPSLTT